MATSEPLPKRPTRKSRRLRGQELQQATPEKVVRSVATPPSGHQSPKILGKYYSLIDWCFCAWLPPSLYLRDPRASLRDCEDRSHSRPLQRKWSGVMPRPPPGALPLRGPPPSLHLFYYVLLLLHALIPWLAAYILLLFLYFLALSSLHPSTF